jgi:hypothetical protein
MSGRIVHWVTDHQHPKPKCQTIAESTHVAAMIYYRNTLFGSGPKLTAVQNGKIYILRGFVECEFLVDN